MNYFHVRTNLFSHFINDVITKKMEVITIANRIITIKEKFYDTGTSNKSFLQVAKDLKALGVKEWYFMLEIKDPSLIRVDPFAVDKDTGHSTCTKDQIQRITLECIHNIWYYLREIARIPSSGSSDGVPYIANRGNIAQTWCLLHGIDSWLCLPRQQGKTKSALAAQNWAYSFGTSASTFIFINKDADNVKTNLSDFADMIACLPEYLRYEQIMDEDGKITKQAKSATRMIHPVTKNKVVVRASASSYEKALGVGRGLTAPILHFDEAEFTPYIDVIVENSVSTFETASRKSKEKGAIYGRIFTSTPGDLDTDPGKRAEGLLAKTVDWTEEIYNWSEKEIDAYIHQKGKSGIVYIEYSYQQIGLTKQWFRNISDKIGNPITVRREILLQRLRGSSASPYDRDDIERLIDIAKKPIDHIMLHKYYKMDIYERLNRSIPYLVGIDCATGNNNDNNAITVVNPYTLKVCAEFECSYVGEPDYIEVIKELTMKHIPRAILCIERNSVGDAIIKFLLQSPVAGRVYFDKFKEIVEENMKELETTESILKKQAQQHSYYGVYTSVKTREAMFSILANWIKNKKENFVGQNVTRDITKLVMKGGKVQAASGFHDDSIMSLLICLYVYYYGNNLEVFGYTKGDELFQLEENKGMIAPEEIDTSDMSEAVKGFVDQKIQESKNPTYEQLMRQQLMETQENTLRLSNKGLIDSDIYKNTPTHDENGYYEGNYGSNSDDLSFFDEINGF